MDEEELRWYWQQIYDNIERQGQSLVSVFDDQESADSGEPPFVYTIGNHERGLPELLLVGAEAGEILNPLGYMMREQRRAPFRHGELVSLGGKFPVKIIDTTPEAKHFAAHVGIYYGTDDYRVQQVLLCDQQGRFPGEPGCAEPYASHPVFALT
jgi:hypothetical protein